MDKHVAEQLEDPDTTAGRDRAAALIRRGLTPRVVRDMIASRQVLQRECRYLDVDADDARWLARRWPADRSR